MKQIIILIFSVITLSIHAQELCVNCDGNQTSSSYSFAAGYNSQASGIRSISIGTNSFASNIEAISIGSYALSKADGSFAIGRLVETGASASQAMVIGMGVSENYKMQNNTLNSLAIGFNSTNPTLFVSPAPTNAAHSLTGKVSIGNIGDNYGIYTPQAKLHIRADDGEEATIFIEPNNWGAGERASIGLGNNLHGISAINNVGLQFHTQLYYTFNEGNVGIGTTKPSYNLHVVGSTFTNMFTLYDEHNPPRDGMVLVSDEAGNANWTDPVNVSLWKVNPNNGVDLYYPEGVEGNVGIGHN